MLKDEPLEYQREQYDEKNEVLRQFGQQVSATALYEDIFDDLDLLMPVLIIDENEKKHAVKMTIEEAIETAKGRNDVLLGASTYFKEFISKATAKDVHALIIDMDNVYSGVLLRAFQLEWRREDGTEIPKPTYIVNSGTGLHLYFVFDRPLPCFKSQLAEIDDMYRKLAVLETTKRVYLPARPSVQWFGQDFRMAGGCGKNGWENTAFCVGEKWNPDELAKACGLEEIHFAHAGEQRTVAPKKDSRRTQQGKRKGYYLNAAVYETAVKRCESETHEGTRYMSMCALSVLAWKCRIPQKRLEEDLKKLLAPYNKGAIRKMHPQEIGSAMKMYNPKALLTPRARTQDWLGWDFHGSRRNGRRQETHLRLARANKAVLKEVGEMKPEGRPKGSGTKAQLVQEWRQKHPEGKPKECIAETGISKNTVYKWWKER